MNHSALGPGIPLKKKLQQFKGIGASTKKSNLKKTGYSNYGRGSFYCV